MSDIEEDLYSVFRHWHKHSDDDTDITGWQESKDGIIIYHNAGTFLLRIERLEKGWRSRRPKEAK